MKTLVPFVTLFAIAFVFSIASGTVGGEDRRVPGEYLSRMSRVWKADSNGAKGMRNDGEDLRDFIDSLRQFVRWRSDVIELLGQPNRVRFVTYPVYVSSPDQAYTALDYYIDPGCHRAPDAPCCSLYFVTKPDQDSILDVDVRCVD